MYRALTNLDIVTRSIANRLLNKFREKITEDLLLTEEAETIKRQGKRKRSENKKKKKKNKRKLSNASAVSVSTTTSV